MRPLHIALAFLVAVIWGANFVIIKLALTGFPPILLTALRFTLAALPVLFVPRPKGIGFKQLALVSTFLFMGHYVFLFMGMDQGMAPGLASIVLQCQAFLTMLIAALMLGERPRGQQLAGAGVAALGLVVTASTVGLDVTWVGFILTLLAAASWATGNVLTRRLPPTPTFPLMVWLSTVPPLPVFALSLAVEGPDRVWAAVTGFSWTAGLSLLYIVCLSTLVAFGIWGMLLREYKASLVAPFSLLVPVTGTVAAHLAFGETFGPVRLAGMALLFAGIVITILPARRPKPAVA
ncbi:EamA family transporter [Niveispirillum sp. KHB5.9]|uniref:EamA family transporter n=1 Tax=Niveispirillum sp. KHB5.9 TaxID=3400269 RepID=UPI003A89DA2E